MTFHLNRAGARGLLAFGFGFALLAAASLANAQPASVQEPTPPDSPPPAQTRTLPTPPEVFGAIGRFIDQSIANVGAGVKGAGDTLGGATNAAGDLAKGVGDAAGTIARLPATNVVAGWERCAVAPNGAPDCVSTSAAMCKAKGFDRGNSLDITSARKCPAQMWREGRAPSDAECTNESFVSRAICQ